MAAAVVGPSWFMVALFLDEKCRKMKEKRKREEESYDIWLRTGLR